MTTNFSGAELLRLVTAIPGVRGNESRPVKDIVRDIQETVIHSLSQSQQYDEEHTNSKTLDSTGSDNDNTPQVRVRVQSLL